VQDRAQVENVRYLGFQVALGEKQGEKMIIN
jgi:hypothetical protein